MLVRTIQIQIKHRQHTVKIDTHIANVINMYQRQHVHTFNRTRLFCLARNAKCGTRNDAKYNHQFVKKLGVHVFDELDKVYKL